MRFVLRSITTAAALAATMVSVAGAQQINSGSTGSYFAEPFGAPNTATYGQTFTAVAGATSLDQFTFQFNFWEGADVSLLTFQGYVMAWDGTEAVGPVLYESGDMNGTNSVSPVTYTFNTSGTAVTAGNVYVAFVNASAYIGAGGDNELMAMIAGNNDIAGEFVYENNGSDFGALTSASWDCHDGCNFGGPGQDAAFTATFDTSATPEPATLSLLGTGLIGMVGFAKRRNRRKA